MAMLVVYVRLDRVADGWDSLRPFWAFFDLSTVIDRSYLHPVRSLLSGPSGGVTKNWRWKSSPRPSRLGSFPCPTGWRLCSGFVS